MEPSLNFPLVSVITPVYNGAAYLDLLILSVQAQDYPYLEHLIIDDGSTDGGATVAVLGRYPHLRWWSRENKGQYPTMNEGLAAAKGEIVIFISADDLMEKNAVSVAVNYLLAHPEKDAVYGDYTYIDAAGVPIFPLRPFRHAPTFLYAYSLHISHSSLFLRKWKLLKNDLSFDPSLRYVGDYDWIIRLLAAPLKIGRVRESLSVIRQHVAQTTNQSFFKMREETFMVQKRHGVFRFGASLFRKVYFLARMLTAARATGWSSAFSLLRERLK
jgi:glycosyltransferase involved in cell wall biosynthesis